MKMKMKLKITIEGKQGAGKTRMARLIYCAILQDPKFWVAGIKADNVVVYDGDDKPPRNTKGRISIVVKQSK